MHIHAKNEDTTTNVFRTPKTHPGWISHWPRRRSLASLHALNGFRPLRRGILQWYSLTSFDWSQRRRSDIKIPMLKKYFWSYWDGNCLTWNGSFSFSFVTASHCLCVHQEPFWGFWNFLVTRLPKITVHQVDLTFPTCSPLDRAPFCWHPDKQNDAGADFMDELKTCKNTLVECHQTMHRL